MQQARAFARRCRVRRRRIAAARMRARHRRRFAGHGRLARRRGVDRPARGHRPVRRARLEGGRPLVARTRIALRADGSFLLADLGDTRRAACSEAFPRRFRVPPHRGTCRGQRLPATDQFRLRRGTVGPPVDHRQHARRRAWSAYRAESRGRLHRAGRRRGARIVADGLCFTNEALISPDGAWLYVNETFGSTTPSRFAPRLGMPAARGQRGRLPRRRRHLAYADGLASDAEGGIWITSIVSNRVIRVARTATRR